MSQHLLLKNPCARGGHIVQFLSRSETRPLIHDRDPAGWSTIQLALKILRPEVVLKLLSVEPSLEADLLLPDPEGLTALHRIATQILHEKVPVHPDERNIDLYLRQPETFADDCKLLWKRCLAAGLDINIPDETSEGNPPLFHFFTQFQKNSRGTYFHTKYFPDLFQAGDFVETAADLSVRSRRGDSLLHAVVRQSESRDDYEASGVVKFLVEKLHFDPLMEDQDGLSVIDLAAKKKLTRIGAIFKCEPPRKKVRCGGCGQFH